MSEQGKTGLEIRREVMGDAFVERAMGNATAFTQPLQDRRPGYDPQRRGRSDRVAGLSHLLPTTGTFR